MSAPAEVTAPVLREWGLPEPGADKKSRGDVAVVGGSQRTPGGVILAAEAVLRVGAGRVGVLAPGSVSVQLGAVLPEAAILTLPDRASEPFTGASREKLADADAVLVGPGFDDADETLQTLQAVADTGPRALVLDAYALGVLPRLDRERLPDRLLLTPNREELARLAGADPDDGELARTVREVARRYRAAVTCYDVVADAEGAFWRVPGGGPGLATSGSGDVLSGAAVGFVARGVDPARAAAWATWVHARAGERLTERMGLGFLARELAVELPLALREVAPPHPIPR